MNKTFNKDSIIQVDDELTVLLATEEVDPFQKTEGWWVVDKYGKTKEQWKEFRLWRIDYTNSQHASNLKGCYRVIATIGPKRLEGVPLIVLEDVPTKKLAKDCMRAKKKELLARGSPAFDDSTRYGFIYGFDEGFKAAQGRWTKGEVNTLARLDAYLEKRRSQLEEMSEEWRLVTDLLIHVELCRKAQALRKKVLTSIMLEYEQQTHVGATSPYRATDGWSVLSQELDKLKTVYQRLKVTTDEHGGIIHPVNVYYE